MEIKSALKIIDPAKIPSKPGMGRKGHTIKALVGTDIPTDRMRATLATYEPKVLEELHWHPIEAFYFVISGSITVRDIEGNESELGPGMSIYCPAGIAGAHEWETGKDGCELIALRATNESVRKMQFTVDKKTKRSYIDIDDLEKYGGIQFKSHY
jgi:mannose-6-phosphate isomerase-like protein (cupin superfamily)